MTTEEAIKKRLKSEYEEMADRLEKALDNARLPKAMAEEPIGYDSARSFVQTLRSGMASKEDYRHALEWAEWLEKIGKEAAND